MLNGLLFLLSLRFAFHNTFEVKSTRQAFNLLNNIIFLVYYNFFIKSTNFISFSHIIITVYKSNMKM